MPGRVASAGRRLAEAPVSYIITRLPGSFGLRALRPIAHKCDHSVTAASANLTLRRTIFTSSFRQATRHGFLQVLLAPIARLRFYSLR